MNKILIIVMLVVVFFYVGCTQTGSSSSGGGSQNLSNGSGDATDITEITPATSKLKDSYEVSSFSEYVFFHKEDTNILLDYNFFPAGSDICQQAAYDAQTNPNGCKQDKTVELPCGYQEAPEDDLLSISLNADPNIATTDCADKIILDMSQAEFTVEGLVFSYDDTLDVFVEDFEFMIAKKGFVDAASDAVLVFDSSEAGTNAPQDIGLETVYQKII